MANPDGRPPKYKTPEQMQRIIDLYFLACRVNRTENADLLETLEVDDLLIINDIDDAHPTVSGLAYALGMTRQNLCNYGHKDQFFDTIKAAKQRVELALEQHLYGTAVTGAIFNLKNNFGWVDKTERESSGSLGLYDMAGKTKEELEAIIAGE